MLPLASPTSRGNVVSSTYSMSLFSDSSSSTLPPASSTSLNPTYQTSHFPTFAQPASSSTSVNNHALVATTPSNLQLLDYLIDTATILVYLIWPLSIESDVKSLPSSANSSRFTSSPVAPSLLPLRNFIHATLRQSRSTFSTLQVALYYIILLRSHIGRCGSTSTAGHPLSCGRRMFLAALILASKYLQDRNFSARAWCKISGLPIPKINCNELVFLKTIDWKLHIPLDVFNRWHRLLSILSPLTPSISSLSSDSVYSMSSALLYPWVSIVNSLSPSLDNLDFLVRLSKSQTARLSAAPSSSSPSYLSTSSESTSPSSMFSPSSSSTTSLSPLHSPSYSSPVSSVSSFDANVNSYSIKSSSLSLSRELPPPDCQVYARRKRSHSSCSTLSLPPLTLLLSHASPSVVSTSTKLSNIDCHHLNLYHHHTSAVYKRPRCNIVA